MLDAQQKRGLRLTKKILVFSLFTFVFLLLSFYFLADAVLNDFLQEKVTGTIVEIKYRKTGNHSPSSFRIQFVYKNDTQARWFFSRNFQTNAIGDAVDLSIPDGNTELVHLYHTSWVISLGLAIFGLFFGLLLFFEIPGNKKNNIIQIPSKTSPIKSKNSRTMSSEAIAGIVLPVIAILITWLAVYLIKKKLGDPDSTTAWGGLIVLSCFALLFVLLTGANWFGFFIQNKSIDIDAEFIGVRSDTVILNQAGEKIYKWKLECQWNNPRSGRQITFQSESFEGSDLHYNRSKIKVSVYPDKADKFYVVDLSYLTTEQGPGLTLITEKMIKEADANFELVQQKNKEFEADQELRKAKTREFMVVVNRIMLVGTILLVIIALGVGGLFYYRYSASQNRIQEFTTITEQQLHNRGWSFSFQSTSEPWVGLFGMLKKEVVEIYPPGFCEIKGETSGTAWKLEIRIKQKATRGYYRSPQDLWLEDSSYSRMTLSSTNNSNNDFIALVEMPTSFPNSIKSVLQQSRTTEGKNYLGDIGSEDDRQLVYKYLGILFDRHSNLPFKSTETHRSAEYHLNKLMIKLSSNQNLQNQILTPDVLASASRLRTTEMGGYGIMIARDEIMISTLKASLKPDEIQAMVDLGLLLKTEIEKMQ